MNTSEPVISQPSTKERCFPQPIPEHIPKKEPNTQPYVKGMTYLAHITTNTIHKKGCPQLPGTGHLKGYNELTKPISKGYVPCDCVKAEFRAARRQRNKSIIDRTEYCFLFSPDSAVQPVWIPVLGGFRTELHGDRGWYLEDQYRLLSLSLRPHQPDDDTGQQDRVPSSAQTVSVSSGCFLLHQAS